MKTKALCNSKELLLLQSKWRKQLWDEICFNTRFKESICLTKEVEGSILVKEDDVVFQGRAAKLEKKADYIGFIREFD